MTEEQISQRQNEIETTLAEIIDTIEKYFLTSPFDFIEGREGEATAYVFPDFGGRFNKFYDWQDRWMGALFPEAYQAQEKLEATGNNADEVGELAFAAQRFGFVLGVLVGMKATGATPGQLKERAQGFVIPAIAHLRWGAKQEEKAKAAAPVQKEPPKLTALNGGKAGNESEITLKGDFKP